MQFYSNLTKTLYNTAKECEEAEASYKKQLEEAEAKKKQLAETKAAEAKAVTEAYKKVREAQKEYDRLRAAFIKNHGYFHFSYSDPDERSVFSLFEDLFMF